MRREIGTGSPLSDFTDICVLGKWPRNRLPFKVPTRRLHGHVTKLSGASNVTVKRVIGWKPPRVGVTGQVSDRRERIAPGWRQRRINPAARPSIYSTKRIAAFP